MLLCGFASGPLRFRAPVTMGAAAECWLLRRSCTARARRRSTGRTSRRQTQSVPADETPQTMPRRPEVQGHSPKRPQRSASALPPPLHCLPAPEGDPPGIPPPGGGHPSQPVPTGLCHLKEAAARGAGLPTGRGGGGGSTAIHPPSTNLGAVCVPRSFYGWAEGPSCCRAVVESIAVRSGCPARLADTNGARLCCSRPGRSCRAMESAQPGSRALPGRVGLTSAPLPVQHSSPI